MIEKIKDIFQKINKPVRYFAVEILLKKIIIPVTFTIFYFLVIGIFSIPFRFFKPNSMEKKKLPGSDWIRAEGYEPDKKSCLKQS